MAVWRLETDTNFTEFCFVMEDDKLFFQDLVKNYFEEAKKVSEKWRPFYLLRGEPKKHPHFFEIDGTDVIAISQRASECLSNFLKEDVELLPIETDAGRYYALNILNYVDCLDKQSSVYVATKTGIIVSYSSLEFNEDKLGNQAIFKIPELPYCTFISDDIQEIYEENYLQGLVFDEESNLVWCEE